MRESQTEDSGECFPRETFEKFDKRSALEDRAAPALRVQCFISGTKKLPWIRMLTSTPLTDSSEAPETAQNRPPPSPARSQPVGLKSGLDAATIANRALPALIRGSNARSSSPSTNPSTSTIQGDEALFVFPRTRDAQHDLRLSKALRRERGEKEPDEEEPFVPEVEGARAIPTRKVVEEPWREEVEAAVVLERRPREPVVVKSSGRQDFGVEYGMRCYW